MQSNITLLTEEFIEIFRELKISNIGTSFDPIPNIRGIGKKRNSDLYNSKFIKATKILNKHKIGWGYIYVITKKSLSRTEEIYHFINNFNSKSGVNIHPVDSFENIDTSYFITPKEFGHFLGELFKLWYPNRDRVAAIQPLNSYYEAYTEGKGMNGCATSGNCQDSHLYISPKGDTSHCGKTADIDAIHYTSIQDAELDEMFNDPQRNIFGERQEILVNGECKECRFWDLCRGGCPADAYSNFGSLSKKTIWCESVSVFLEQYLEPITGLKRDFSYV